jgi:hypothetical protein
MLLSMLLDLVKVPKSHTGLNLAAAFAEVLEAFGIQEQVRYISGYRRQHLVPV